MAVDAAKQVGQVPGLEQAVLLPAWLLVGACQWALRTSYAELIVARHATVAREEMAVLAEQLHAMMERSAGIAAQAPSPEHEHTGTENQ